MLIVGLGAAIAGSGAPYTISAGNSAADGVTISLVGILFAQLVLGVLGVLAFSGEYATGMIRATPAIVPSRVRAAGLPVQYERSGPDAKAAVRPRLEPGWPNASARMAANWPAAASATRLAGHGPARSRHGDATVISVLLVDDHALIRMGFRPVLDAEDDIEGGR